MFDSREDISFLVAVLAPPLTFLVGIALLVYGSVANLDERDSDRLTETGVALVLGGGISTGVARREPRH